MARRKVTKGELQRIQKAREIKKRKNTSGDEEEPDGEKDVCAVCDDGGSLTW